MLLDIGGQEQAQLVGYRKVITPQRDMFARLLTGVDTLRGMTEEDARYFRDLYDHLIRSATSSTPTATWSPARLTPTWLPCRTG
jgi:Mg2+ and Co2+ transporter CorA